MINTSETVIIIGGGIIGSLTAWSLRVGGFGGHIRILERDPCYSQSSTTLSAASIRSQFENPINIEMSLYGAKFIKTLKQNFGPEADAGFIERGYLILSAPENEKAHRALTERQQALGAKVSALSLQDIARRFPFVNVDDLGFGSFGEENEGWFDAWALLQLVRQEAKRRDIEYIHAEAAEILLNNNIVSGVKTRDGVVLSADWCVNAAGPASGRIANWLGIKLPVEARKRTVFHIKAPLDNTSFPMLFDNSGVWIRPEGDGFITGIAPPEDRDPDADGDFEPDYSLFDELLWPALANRIPALESLRLVNAWAGHYEYNLLDHNGVIGFHDEIRNLLFATGFSGHGLMHAPATARGISELIIHGQYKNIDLSVLGFERIRDSKPIKEGVIY